MKSLVNCVCVSLVVAFLCSTARSADETAFVKQESAEKDTPDRDRFEDLSGRAKKIPWGDFSSAKLKELRDKNKPVLVFCRADWDATGKILERTLFTDKRVIEAIKRQMYVPLLADFTHPSEEIKGFVRDVGSRPGEVTIVVFHGPKDEAPIVLQMEDANKFISTEDLLTAMKSESLQFGPADSVAPIAKEHVRNLLEGNFDEMEKSYAKQIILMPGNELLKAKYGLAGPKGERQAITVDRTKLLETMKTSLPRPLVAASIVDKVFHAYRFEPLKTKVGDFATFPPDPVDTPDGKLHLTIADGDVLFKVGPEKGDFMLFQFRQIDGKWQVVAEYLD